MSIFLDLVEEATKINMDDFSVYESTFEHCLKNQEKNIFTCPDGTFSFRNMSFGLCNAPATF